MTSARKRLYEQPQGRQEIEQVTGLLQVSYFCRPLPGFTRLFSGRTQPSVPRLGEEHSEPAAATC